MRNATSYGSSIVNDKSGCVLVISCLGLNTTDAILEPTISPAKRPLYERRGGSKSARVIGSWALVDTAVRFQAA